MGKFIDLTGKQFGKLTVLEYVAATADHSAHWLCRCECGNECTVQSRVLREGLQKSCGCGRRRDLTGKRFGKLTAVERSDRYVETKSGGRKYLWKCVCDCGEVVYRLPEKLRDHTNSACDRCGEQSKVAAMVQSAGYAEGTQLKKIASTKAQKTSKSGIRGVFFNNRTGKWRAVLMFQGVNHYLGEYRELADAVKARTDAEALYYGPILEKHKMFEDEKTVREA